MDTNGLVSHLTSLAGEPSPDGEQFIMISDDDAQSLAGRRLNVVLNWTDPVTAALAHVGLASPSSQSEVSTPFKDVEDGFASRGVRVCNSCDVDHP